MATGRLHDFHLVMGRGMKEDLRGLDLYEKAGSLSGVVVKVLSLLGPVINREHQWGEQRFAKYMPVTADPDEVREDVHVYMPEEVYRQVKLLHADLNYYSIAQMVRDFLRFFLDLVKEYGDKIFDELQKLFKNWKKENRNCRLTPVMLIRQLWRIIRHLPGQTGLINLYYSDFSPFWIFRL